MNDWFASWGRLLADTGRVLRDHWPQLVGLCLIGIIGRMGFLWLAVWASGINGTLGALILPLAPLSTLITLILMLRVASETLTAFSHTYRGNTFREHWRHHLLVATEVLLPFLAAYAAQGLVAQDSRLYVHDITYDESGNFLHFNSERYNYGEGWYLAAMVIGAILIRKTIALTEAFRRSVVIALIAIYLEAFWMVTLTNAFMWQVKEIGRWLRDRAVVDAVIAQLEGFMSWLGPVREFLLPGWDWLVKTCAGLGPLVVLPLAWLAIGASSYQTDLVTRTDRSSASRRLGKSFERVPGFWRRVLEETGEPVLVPLRALRGALSRVLIAGPAPVVMFCLSFVAVDQVQVGVAWLLREAVGPRPYGFDLALRPYLDSVSQLVYSVLAMALLAASVNLVVGGRRIAAPRPDSPGDRIAVPRRAL